ncbi:MAG TPA: hypothetical protein VI431_11450, partial [Candidatus Acidoferrum sp.]
VRSIVAFFLFFFLLRTAFLTSLETPEPRYVLECFPALIALGAAAIWKRKYKTEKARRAGET